MAKSFETILIFVAVATVASGCATVRSLSGLEQDAQPATAPIATVTPLPAPASVPIPIPTIRGMESEKLLALWGPPTLRRRDIGSELWTYKQPLSNCSVLLYLYPASDGRMVVLKGEAVPGGLDDDAVNSCATANNLPRLKPLS